MAENVSTLPPQQRSQALLERASTDFFKSAYKERMGVSAFMETQDPSSDHPDSQLDAFERVLKAAGIRTKSYGELGMPADTFEAFLETPEKRALAFEWVTRTWKRAATGRNPSTRAIFVTSDNPVGSAAQPYTIATDPRFQQVAPQIPINELVAITTGIEKSGAYEAFYLTPDTDQTRLKRVAEGAEVPRAKLVGGSHVIRLKKYGRALEISYEQLRRMRIDMVAMYISLLAVQNEADKVSSIINVLVNGDGNTGTAGTVYPMSTLDSAAVLGRVSMRAYLAFKMKFKNPYAMTTAMVRDDVALDLQLLNMGSANIPLLFIQAMGGFGGFRPINPSLADNVGLGWGDDAPAGKVVAFDKRWAIERVYEVGGNITEVDKWITNQTQMIVMTEIEGYDTFNPWAVKILDTNS